MREKLVYFPTVTREDFHNRGRITELIESGELFERLDVPAFSTENDRIMLCGSPDMLKEVRLTLEARGFTEGNMSEPGHFVLERPLWAESLARVSKTVAGRRRSNRPRRL